MPTYDETWKEALNQWFEPFLAFFFSNVHQDIDWDRGWESLDNELQQVVRDAEFGVRRADKLVKVWLRDGEEVCVLIHIEIQSQRETGFERRMYVYQYRIFDRYNLPVVALVVLGDENPSWRPRSFGFTRWGCELLYSFPPIKLLDFGSVENALESSPNPISALVFAHLSTLAQPDDNESRFARKRRVVRSLYERGMQKQMVLDLFRLVDWMMTLPEGMQPLFREEHHRWEEEKKMPYVTTFERLAREEGKAEGKAEGMVEGLREGLLEGIELCLKLKFGVEGMQCLSAVRGIKDIERLRRIKLAIESVVSLDEFREQIQK